MRAEMAKVVYPVLNYGLKLKERRERGESPPLDTEQAVLKGLLKTDELALQSDFYGDARSDGAYPGAEGRGAAIGNEPFLGIRYALCCWLDEILIDSSAWGIDWDQKKLERALYSSADRAWKFPIQAEMAEKRESTDAIEVFMLCVMLGFRGEWQERRERLQTWVSANQARIARNQREQWPAPRALPEPPTNVPHLRGWEKFQKMRRVRSAVVLFGLLVATVLVVKLLIPS
jgi:type VI secretion system protein ImpK